MLKRDERGRRYCIGDRNTGGGRESESERREGERERERGRERYVLLAAFLRDIVVISILYTHSCFSPFLFRLCAGRQIC